jgi:hypothetical protein
MYEADPSDSWTFRMAGFVISSVDLSFLLPDNACGKLYMPSQP